MDSNTGNMYFEFIIFTLLITTLASVFYLPIFKINTKTGFKDRVIRIFIFSAVLFVLLKKLGFTFDKIISKLVLLVFIIYVVYLIYSLFDYFNKQNLKSRPGALKLLLLLIGLLIIIAMKDAIKTEISYMIN
jgi:hypothetical protein|tara:strand:- start:331 stop:726 length:396 start_codon:yes stop_codon:yes gene_type:complete